MQVAHTRGTPLAYIGSSLALLRKGAVYMNPKAIFGLLRDSFKEWSEDKASRLGAALAYYTIFSIGPLLIIAIAIA